MAVHYEVLIFGHNEAGTIEMTLRAVLDQGSSAHSHLDRIVVVSTASTDGTDEIVRAIAEEHPIVQLRQIHLRRGKVFDVNEAVASSSAPILVIVDADIALPGKCIPLLVEHLASRPNVGMTVPERAFRNARAGLPNLVGHLTAEVQNNLDRPKAGQVLAIRREYASVDERVSVDDAYQEYAVLSAGYEVVRVPGATAVAVAPRTLREYVRQRRRVSAQYHRLKDVTGYRPATCSLSQLARAVVRTDTLSPDPPSILVGVGVF